MAEGVMVIGPSGSGKSASTEGMTQTFFINTIGKRFPYRNDYKSQKIPTPPPTVKIEQMIDHFPEKMEEGVSVIQTDSAKVLEASIKYIDKHRPDIKKIVVDDWQYVAANDFMRKANVKGFDKFTQIGRDIWSMANTVSELEREDLIVYFLTHSEDITDPLGNKSTKAKTIGKLVDNVITLEGMFTIVLYAGSELNKNKEPEYFIYTHNNGSNTCKSPKGMFDQSKIPNELAKVDSTIREFYSLD
jgi:hypothetical protein